MTPDQLYQLVKNVEHVFAVPAPYKTITVGTFDDGTGKFTGLTTRVETDPEPVAHGPHDQPVNPPGRFVGEVWITTSIDSRWRRTTTRTPAPRAGAAPVSLQFAITHPGGDWSVTVNGKTTSAPASQTTISCDIWDCTSVGWTIHCGSRSHSDHLLIQRDGALIGLGAFTIPALPVSIVYAPPVDAERQSTACYGRSETIGTTLTISLSGEASTARPAVPARYADVPQLKAILDVAGQALGKIQNPYAQAIGGALSTIAGGLGTMTATATTGKITTTETQAIATETLASSLCARADVGGPGSGDAFQYFRDVKCVWLMYEGLLRITPIQYASDAALSASYLKSAIGNPSRTGLPDDALTALLALDPFVAGGPTAALPTDRFELRQTLEYGGGLARDGSDSYTFSTTTTRKTASYTTRVEDYTPGWLSSLLGVPKETIKSTWTFSSAAADTQSRTVSVSWHLASGASERFVVELLFDRLFGTFAFRPVQASPTARLLGTAAARQLVRLTTSDGKTFSTQSDGQGRYAFFASTLHDGPASLAVGNAPAQPISIGAATLAAVTLASPEDGHRFSSFPRTTTLTWHAVPGATHYKVEVEYASPAPGGGTTWLPLTALRVPGTSATFDFVGRQPGRWRVTALDASGAHQASPPSAWRGFIYTV